MFIGLMRKAKGTAKKAQKQSLIILTNQLRSDKITRNDTAVGLQYDFFWTIYIFQTTGSRSIGSNLKPKVSKHEKIICNTSTISYDSIITVYTWKLKKFNILKMR